MNYTFSDHAGNSRSDSSDYSHERLMAEGWPDDFDFETDHACQKVFKPFIEEQLKILESYDAQRDLKSDYIFHQHAYDAAQDVKNTCSVLGLGDRVANNMYYATLIHDIGKPELPLEIWDTEGSPSAEERAQKRAHVNIGADIFEQKFVDIDHPFKALALDIISNHHERMDGFGENKLSAEQLSMPARLVCIVEDYDGRTHLRSHHIAAGRTNDTPSVFEHMEEKMTGAFDLELYDAFKTMKMEDHKFSQTPSKKLSSENDDLEIQQPE